MSVFQSCEGLKKVLCHPFFTCLQIGLFSTLVFAGLQYLGRLQNLELHVYDQLLLMRPETAIDDRITVIGETEADLSRYGHPLPDQVLADALQRLEQRGAKVIGVDIYRDIDVPPGKEALKKLLSENQNIVWIFFTGNQMGQYIAPPKALAEKPEQTGFSDVVEDGDGVLRRGVLFLDVKGISYYSFPLLIALQYLSTENILAENDEQNNLRLNGTSFPNIDSNFGAYRMMDSGGYQIMLEYPGLPAAYRYFTLSDVLDGKIPDAAVKDKILLIGGTAPSLQDYKLLPNQARRYGVEMHGYFISQILNTAILHKKPLRAWSDNYEYGWLFFWCLIGAFTGVRKGGLAKLFGLLFLELLLLFASSVLSLNQGWWLTLIAPLFGWGGALALSVFYFSSRDRAERRQLMQMFASHVSPEVANRLWEVREQFFSEGGVRPDTLTATVLFTDLCNFTTVAENMEPLALMKWLNEYMDEMSRCVIEHGGIINKYIGDAIMAVFGVPIKSETEAAIASDAQRAVKCATEFSRRLIKLNQKWRMQGLPVITMRTGIHTGALVAGSFGGSLRMEYTVIGDTVNTASRLESFDKTVAQATLEQPCRILIGETTYQYLQGLYQTEKVGVCQLKGKNTQIIIYHVLTL